MKYVFRNKLNRIAFKDLNVGEFYYDSDDNLCMKIHENSNLNCVVIKIVTLTCEEINELVTPVDAELIIK